MIGKQLAVMGVALMVSNVSGMFAAPIPHAEQPVESDLVTVVVAQDSAGGRLGLEGYCPIELNEMYRWTKGEDHLTVDYEGQRFHFASEAAREKFLAKPTDFAPSHRGFDVVLQRDHELLRPGKRQHGLVHHGRIHLFTSEETLEIFCKSPERYSSDAE
jgi:YHS domain-containing protein